MTERGDPEFPQVLGAQRQQQTRVDVVLTKCRLVLLQSQSTQPRSDVHPRSSDQACSLLQAAATRIMERHDATASTAVHSRAGWHWLERRHDRALRIAY